MGGYFTAGAHPFFAETEKEGSAVKWFARFCSIILGLTLLLSSCGGKENASANAQAGSAETTGKRDGDRAGMVHTYSGFSDEAAEKLGALADDYGAVAVQVAYYGGGDEILTYTCGYADLETKRAATEDTKYRVASISKLVTSVLFMAAADRGFVDEAADISEYFGESCVNPRYPDVPITPAMLMTHLSSLDSDGEPTWAPGLLSARSTYLDFRPGTQYAYSNFGFGVLSCLLEKATGKSLNALAKELLFEPLGIEAAYTLSAMPAGADVGLLYGEGGLTLDELDEAREQAVGTGLQLSFGNLIISAKDYVQILSALLHKGVCVDGEKLLSAESVASLLEQRFDTGDYGVAFGTQIQTNVIDGATVYVHTGSANGMFSAFVFDPATKRAAVALTTGEERSLDPETEVYHLCQELIRAVWGAEGEKTAGPPEK